MEKTMFEITKETPNGISCYFFIHNGRGLKMFKGFYNNEDTVTQIRNTQQRAFEIGCAPEAFEVVQINDRWCYYTEIVTPAFPYYATLNGKELFDRFSEDEEVWKLFDEELWEVKVKLGDIDIDTGDDHPGNWGFKNGKLVFIDFSH